MKTFGPKAAGIAMFAVIAARFVVVLLAAFACFAAAAKTARLETLPESDRQSTEASTNILLKSAGSIVRVYDISLSFSGTPSNSVEIALGRDADGDGVLGLDETGAAFGWRCGAVFAEGGAVRFAEPSAVTDAAPIDMALKITSNRALSPKAVDFSCGGVNVLSDIFAEPPEWSYDPSWNMLRLTRRGVDVAGENGTAETDLMALVMTFR